MVIFVFIGDKIKIFIFKKSCYFIVYYVFYISVFNG